MSAFELDTVVPVGCVEKSSLVFVESWNGRPSPVVQNSASVDKNVTVIMDLRIVFQIGNLDIIATLLVVPVSSRNLMLWPDVVKELIFAGKRVEVAVNLLASRVNTSPVKFWFE
jgi:hypothetical protein